MPWQDGQAKDAELGAVHLLRLVRTLPQLRGVVVLGKEGSIVKAVQSELAYVRGLEWKLTSSSASRAYNQHVKQLKLDLQVIAQGLNLI